MLEFPQYISYDNKMIDLRKNTKVSMNRQPLVASSIFSDRGVNVKWPTFRKVYMNVQNVQVLKEHVTSKGRSIVFKERGEILLLKFVQELAELGTPELLPKLEGKKMFVVINPKKK